MRATQPVSVGGVTFDALIESNEDLNSDIPQYPVEEGFEVADTIINHPLELKISAVVTTSSVSWGGSGAGRLSQVEEGLMRLYEAKELVTVLTTDKTYDDMGIENISITKPSESGYKRNIEISLRNVRTTKTKEIKVKNNSVAGNGTADKKESETKAEESKYGQMPPGVVEGSIYRTQVNHEKTMDNLLFGSGVVGNEGSSAPLNGFWGKAAASTNGG